MAKSKKSFNIAPVNYFMSVPQEDNSNENKADALEIHSDVNEHVVEETQLKPPGKKRLDKELRNKNFSVMTTPTLFEEFNIAAKFHNITVNSVINQLMKEYVQQNREIIDEIKEMKRKSRL